MRGFFITGWILTLCIATILAGCSRENADTSRPPDGPCGPPARPCGKRYSPPGLSASPDDVDCDPTLSVDPIMVCFKVVDAKMKPKDLVPLVRERLEAFGFANVQVNATAARHIRVRYLGPHQYDDTIPERIERVVGKPLVLAIAPVDPGEAFFAASVSRLPSTGGLRVGTDTLGIPGGSGVARIGYWAADDPAALVAHIKRVSPPPGRKLVTMRGRDGALAFLVHDPPPVNIQRPTRVRVDGQTDGPVAVVMELDSRSREPVQELLRSSLYRPLAFLVDGEVVALPFVTTMEERGEIRIVPSPVASEGDALYDAESLASMLRTWPPILMRDQRGEHLREWGHVSSPY